MSRHVELPATATQADLLAAIDDFNGDPGVDAFIVQLPLPAAARRRSARCSRSIPTKDADGLHPVNLGRLVIGAVGPRPCTPLGIQALLAHHHVPIEGQHVVIVGRGLTIGRPLAVLLSLKEPNANATVTLCHTGTKFLPEYTRQADIVSRPRGRPTIIIPDMVQPGAVVVGAGHHDGGAARSSPTSTRRAPRSRAGSHPGWAASARRPVPCCCGTPSRRPNARAWQRHEHSAACRAAGRSAALHRVRARSSPRTSPAARTAGCRTRPGCSRAAGSGASRSCSRSRGWARSRSWPAPAEAQASLRDRPRLRLGIRRARPRGCTAPKYSAERARRVACAARRTDRPSHAPAHADASRRARAARTSRRPGPRTASRCSRRWSSTNLPLIDEEERELLPRLLDDARGGLTIPRIALRHRLQHDVHGLDRSRHRMLGEDGKFVIEIDGHGAPRRRRCSARCWARRRCRRPGARSRSTRSGASSRAGGAGSPPTSSCASSRPTCGTAAGRRSRRPARGMPGGPPDEEMWRGVASDQRWAMEVLGLRVGHGGRARRREPALPPPAARRAPRQRWRGDAAPRRGSPSSPKRARSCSMWLRTAVAAEG